MAAAPGFAAADWLEAADGQGLPILFLAHEERAQQDRDTTARVFTVAVRVDQVQVRRVAVSAPEPGGVGRAEPRRSAGVRSP